MPMLPIAPTPAVPAPPVRGVEPRLPERPGERVVLEGIDWETYVAMEEQSFRAGRRLRFTYNRGTLEIMSPSRRHEGYKRIVGRLVEALTEELDMPMQGHGETTLRRRESARGGAPDESYQFHNLLPLNEQVGESVEALPRPDLVVEVDVTSSSEHRLALYAALGVPEVWRMVDDRLRFFSLRKGTYSRVETSVAFPGLRAEDLQPFIRRAAAEADTNEVVRAFRRWVRDELKLR